MSRRYSAEAKAEAIGYALVAGSTEAAKRTGVSRRAIDGWLRDRELVASVAKDAPPSVTDRLWQAVEQGADALLAGLRDPASRLSDRARAMEVASRAWATLAAGERRVDLGDDAPGDRRRAADAEYERWLESLMDGATWEQRVELRNAMDTAQAAALEEWLVRYRFPVPEATQRWFDAHKARPALGDGRNGTS